VKIDPGDLRSEIIPVRQVSTHENVVWFLEQSPCVDCLKIAAITPAPSGTYFVTISIKHPFTTPLLTGFDVRGIVIFNGNKTFPEAELTISDSALGGGELLNADGYSTLYNLTTVDYSPFEGYLKGNLATATMPDATLNGFRLFISEKASNTRNAFLAGDTVTAMYILKLTSPLVFGYAIDASWAPPIHQPVADPMTDFGPEANCQEAWKMVVWDTPVGDGLTDCGGQARLTIDMYDWQGKDDTHSVYVECPELSPYVSQATWKQDGVGFARYETIVENAGYASAGIYKCLVIKRTDEPDPSAPGEYITAYQVHELDVSHAPHSNDLSLVWAKHPGSEWNDEGFGITTLPDDSTVVTGYFENVATFGEGEPNQTQLFSAGQEDIFIARYNPDGTLAWAKRAGGPGEYDDEGRGITTLSDDSTVVTGYFNEIAIFGQNEPNQTLLTAVNLSDIFVARYNPDGILAWAKGAGGPYWDEGSAITTLSDDSTVVTGRFQETATFGQGEPNQTQLSTDGHDGFMARYNPDGTLAWAKRTGATLGGQGSGITALSDDSTVVTGYFSGTATFGEGESNQTKLVSEGSDDIFIARYNSDGTLAWAKSAGGPNWGIEGDEGLGVTTLSDNSTVVTGSFKVRATFGQGEPNQTTFVQGDGWDVFIARYNPDGTLAWAKRALGAGWEQGFGITALSDNSTIVTGHLDTTAIFGPGEPNQTQLVSAGSHDIFIARYNPDGTLAWAKRAGGLEVPDLIMFGLIDAGYGITTLSDDTTVVTGGFSGTATFGPCEPNQTQLVSDGGQNVFVARYRP
jgi:uncharacterized delta-60 repeat protein